MQQHSFVNFVLYSNLCCTIKSLMQALKAKFCNNRPQIISPVSETRKQEKNGKARKIINVCLHVRSEEMRVTSSLVTKFKSSVYLIKRFYKLILFSFLEKLTASYTEETSTSILEGQTVDDCFLP